ncbi:MAG: hypothetical protein U0L55_06340 [Acutalibacteraceae bacterium]|nr:hypothetical protein [Acutalibacteraceae bacterium]
MKKIICIIFSFCLPFLLFACSSSTPKQITVAEAGYSCNADVLYGDDLSFNITVNAIGGGLFSVKVNTPEDIAGLTFSFDNSEMTVSYGDNLTLSDISPKYGGFAEILNEIFLKFTTGRPNIPFEEGAYILEGNNAEYSFSVVFGEEGFPLSVIVPEENLTATFSNWKY